MRLAPRAAVSASYPRLPRAYPLSLPLPLNATLNAVCYQCATRVLPTLRSLSLLGYLSLLSLLSFLRYLSSLSFLNFSSLANFPPQRFPFNFAFRASYCLIQWAGPYTRCSFSA